jgi:hypothetical protein
LESTIHPAAQKRKEGCKKMPEESHKGARNKAAPLWSKKAGISPEQRAAMVRGARKARRKAAEKPLSPVQTRFLVEVCTNGGNPRAAANAIGISPTTGKAWMQLPQVAEAFRHYRMQAEGKLKDWSLLVDRAQETLVDLLDSKDDRVRIVAANTILDRGLGKVANKVEGIITHQEALTGVALEAALSLVAGAGMTLHEASAYVREHPEEVANWAIANPPKPPARLQSGPIVDAEVIASDVAVTQDGEIPPTPT